MTRSSRWQSDGEVKISDSTGVIRCAFSGAQEYDDVLVVLLVYRSFASSERELFPDTGFYHNLDKVRELPVLGTWARILDL